MHSEYISNLNLFSYYECFQQQFEKHVQRYYLELRTFEKKL